MLSLLLLGPPHLSLDGQPLTAPRRKNRALLYCLAASPRPLTRDEVLAFLWPDHPRPAAQGLLRTTLSELRRQLGPALVAEADTLALAADTLVDTRRLEAGVTAPGPATESALAAALDLYRGEFLQGFTLDDPPEFDGWLAEQRQRYRALALRGLAALAGLLEQQGDAAAALEVLERALALDPLDEARLRAALRLHYRLGNRAAAIRRYEMLRRQLDEELGVLPSPETRALYDALISDGPALLAAEPVTAPPARAAGASPLPPAAPAPLLPFTGRAAELALIEQAAGQGQFVLLEGEPGIGKTRLAEEYVARRRPDQPLVLRGAAYESEQGLPYQPLVDALRGLRALPEWPALRPPPGPAPGWLGEVTRLLPELLGDWPDPAGAGHTSALPASLPDQARVWEGVSQLLQSLARQRPVILLLDDLHWADAATVGLAGYLARRATSPALGVLATARPAVAESPLGRLLPALEHEHRLARVRLPTLTPADTRQVASRLSPAEAARLADWLGANAEGNPFFLTELVRFAQHGGLLRADGTLDHHALAATPILPATVENLIRSRLVRLSTPARRALEVAAVAGREFDFELVPAVAGQAETAALDALDELRAAGLISPTSGGQYRFDHSLTMEVAYRDMGEPRLRGVHRRVAETLERAGHRVEDAAGTIAYHFARAGLLQRAGPHAFRAGQRSAALAAWAEAIAFYQQALQAEPADPERLAARLGRGEARFHSGDFAGAADDYQAAIPLATAQRDWPSLEAAYLALNLALLPQARYAESIALAQALRRDGPPALAVCAEFIWGATLSVQSAHPVEAEQHVRAAERLLDEPAAASRVSRAQIKYQLAGIVGQQGRAAEAVALYRAALDLAGQDEQALDLLRRIMLYNNLAYQLSLLGELGPASEYARTGIRLAQERGSLTHLSYLLSTSGEIALARGELDAAEQLFTEGLALARQVPIAERIAGHTANLGLVATRRGQAALARARLREALGLADALGASHLAVRIRIWLAPLLPRAEAVDLLGQARAEAEAGGYRSLLGEIERLTVAAPTR